MKYKRLGRERAAMGTVALFGLLVTTALHADYGSGQVDRLSLWFGFLGVEYSEQGELGRCEALPGLPTRLVERSTFVRLAGVCDDQGERPCNGQFTRLVERCIANDLRYRVDDEAPQSYFDSFHPVQTYYVKGQVRICFDQTASGMCADVDEVARGTYTQWFTDHFFQNPPQANAFADWDFTQTTVDELTITHSKGIEFAGAQAKMRKGKFIGEAVNRFNDECFFRFDEDGFQLNANRCPTSGHLVHDVK